MDMTVEKTELYDIRPAIAVLCSLPSYVKVELALDNGRTVEGQTRDLPREGRRLTMGGFEWFCDQESFERAGVVGVTVAPFEMRLGYR